jgi:hypothetical protein
MPRELHQYFQNLRGRRRARGRPVWLSIFLADATERLGCLPGEKHEQMVGRSVLPKYGIVDIRKRRNFKISAAKECPQQALF